MIFECSANILTEVVAIMEIESSPQNGELINDRQISNATEPEVDLHVTPAETGNVSNPTENLQLALYTQTNRAYSSKGRGGFNGPFPVERVMKKRVREGRVEYLLKWTGLPESECTWEPHDSIHSESLIEQLEKELKKKQEAKRAFGFERSLTSA